MTNQKNILKSYGFPIILLSSIMLGSAVGFYAKDSAQALKPLGDIFLNLILTCIVPLIFFSVSSAIAQAGSLEKLRRIFSSMTIVFLFTSIFTAALAIIVVLLFPPAKDVFLTLQINEKPQAMPLMNQLTEIFTVSDFSLLLSHKHMLALIVFSILVGIASTHESLFTRFLKAGEIVFTRIFSLIMLYAPIGFFAYFAVLVSDFGTALMQNYLRIATIYYSFALLYFFLIYTFFASIAGGRNAIFLFWENIFLPAATAVATCSSAASIPANIIATKAMNVSPEIVETSIPLGTIIHKDGSIIGGVFKIAFLFGVFHWNFSNPSVLLTALGMSILVGTVMGAIPSGGMLGELLILSVYGFPPSALIAIAAISIIIDPIATLLNVTGNSVCCMLISRLVTGRNWYLNYPRKNI